MMIIDEPFAAPELIEYLAGATEQHGREDS